MALASWWMSIATSDVTDVDDSCAVLCSVTARLSRTTRASDLGLPGETEPELGRRCEADLGLPGEAELRDEAEWSSTEPLGRVRVRVRLG